MVGRHFSAVAALGVDLSWKKKNQKWQRNLVSEQLMDSVELYDSLREAEGKKSLNNYVYTV